MPFHNLFGGRDSEMNDRIVLQAVQRKKGGRVSEKMERCLACEAVVNEAGPRGRSLVFLHSMSWPAVVWTFRGGSLKSRHDIDRRPEQEITVRFFLVHHGLASEATLHGSDRSASQARHAPQTGTYGT